MIRTLVERQALEELHEVNNHQEELGGSGYSSRETEYIKLDRDKSTFKSHRDFSSEKEISFKHF